MDFSLKALFKFVVKDKRPLENSRGNNPKPFILENLMGYLYKLFGSNWESSGSKLPKNKLSKIRISPFSVCFVFVQGVIWKSTNSHYICRLFIERETEDNPITHLRIPSVISI